MAGRSKIEWTQATWNPLAGCSLVSPGCTNCYAMRMAHRLASNPRTPHYAGTTKTVNGKPVWMGRVNVAPDHVLTAPIRRRKPTMYFVNSMSDLFHESVPFEVIDRVFGVMALCPQHVFQVLTKRSDRMLRYCLSRFGGECNTYVSDASMELPHGLSEDDSQAAADWTDLGKPLPNVWLIVSTEDQRRADERIPDLLATPAAVRGVSAEPLLSDIFLAGGWLGLGDSGSYGCGRLDWVIVGGESGPGARPMHPDWARSLRGQCAAAEVPFFFKQWGEHAEVGPREAPAVAVYADGRSCRFERDAIARLDSADPVRDGRLMYRVGKKRAGRLLDGVIHDAMPEARA